MRLSELYRKEIIHINRAERMGVLGNADLEFNQTTGQIEKMLIPAAKMNPFSRVKEEYFIPWNDITSVGKEMILIQEHESQLKENIHKIPEKEE
ncbi:MULTISPECIES: YlmC/YmxH family sporulation protein [Jeotgalibacillus]|uniref:YlmC/YmxH family sporulation protein n=1 Tax=Jeotgalibacillus TaxID=157226 RepID=UPI00106AD6C2|nr:MULTISPECIES: YlmC/YmxH family sporulation protein [Jeotgalibacillus]TFE03450.1 YlmC/YmxH family sporulation protein [Jeotgalibacillus sp. R-1-5s-1]